MSKPKIVIHNRYAAKAPVGDSDPKYDQLLRKLHEVVDAKNRVDAESNRLAKELSKVQQELQRAGYYSDQVNRAKKYLGV